MHLKKICVYCGSNIGRRPIYKDVACRLANALVERDIGLVYGGATVGLMGAIADTVMAAGGTVVGVIPESLVEKEIAHDGLTELVVTSSMHERKSVMAEHADAFIALPGGIGTLEELFEVWTWAQLGFHAKPCGLLNVAGYFDAMGDFLDRAVAETFVKPQHRSMLVVESDPNALLDRFSSYKPPTVEKWVDRQQQSSDAL